MISDMVQIDNTESGQKMIWIPPNEAMLAIARLYLEKYEVLAEEDRALFRAAIQTFNNGRDAWIENSEIHA